MKKNRSVKLPVLLFAGVVAWGGSAATAVAQSAGGGDADLEEMAAYRLTMDGVQRWYRAQRNVYAKFESGPGLAERAEEDRESDEFSIDRMAARFEEIPEVRGAIEDAGLEVREFVVITMALFQASMAQAAIEMGADRASIIEESGVHPDNVDFVRDNKVELERMRKEVEAMKAAAGVSS